MAGSQGDLGPLLSVPGFVDHGVSQRPELGQTRGLRLVRTRAITLCASSSSSQLTYAAFEQGDSGESVDVVVSDPLPGHRERIGRTLVPRCDVLNARQLVIGHDDRTRSQVIFAVVPERSRDLTFGGVDAEVRATAEQSFEFGAFRIMAGSLHEATLRGSAGRRWIYSIRLDTIEE